MKAILKWMIFMYKFCVSDLDSYVNHLIYHTDNNFCDLNCSLFVNNDSSRRYKVHILIFNSGNRKHRIIDEVAYNVNTCKHKIFSNRSNSISKILCKIHNAKALILIGKNDGVLDKLISSSCIMLDNLFNELDNLIVNIDSNAMKYELNCIFSN